MVVPFQIPRTQVKSRWGIPFRLVLNELILCQIKHAWQPAFSVNKVIPSKNSTNPHTSFKLGESSTSNIETVPRATN
jgi:hypothetical protein